MAVTSSMKALFTCCSLAELDCQTFRLINQLLRYTLYELWYSYYKAKQSTKVLFLCLRFYTSLTLFAVALNCKDLFFGMCDSIKTRLIPIEYNMHKALFVFLTCRIENVLRLRTYPTEAEFRDIDSACWHRLIRIPCTHRNIWKAI